MGMRFWIPMCLVALATPCHADNDNKAVADIANGIVSYRLSATYCRWPIPEKLTRVLSSDENHFREKNLQAFETGVKEAMDNFHLLTTSSINYCKEIKQSRASMTRSLEQRSK